MRIDVNKALVVLAGVTAASCSGYSKVLKSNDSNLKYQTAIEYTDKGKYNKALTLFQDVAHVYAQSARADTLAYYTGLCYYKSGDFVSSAELFDGFRRRFGRSPFLEDAEYMYAKGFYFSSPKPEYDQTATHQALQAITEYLDRYPNSVKKDQLIENMIELRQKLYDKAFMNAKVYYDIGSLQFGRYGASERHRYVSRERSPRRAAYLIVSAHCLYARNSVARCSASGISIRRTPITISSTNILTASTRRRSTRCSRRPRSTWPSTATCRTARTATIRINQIIPKRKMEIKKSSIPTNTVTRTLTDIDAPTGNIYESVVVIARRANQIASEIKQELNRKLADFSSVTDSLEETFENREQIEISKYYERLPKPTLVATEEFLEGKVYFRENRPEPQPETIAE